MTIWSRHQHNETMVIGSLITLDAVYYERCTPFCHPLFMTENGISTLGVKVNIFSKHILAITLFLKNFTIQ